MELTGPMGAHAWSVLRWPVGATFLWWGGVWLCVAGYYMRSGARQWRAACGSRYTGGPAWLWAHGVLIMALGGLAKALRGQFSKPYHITEMPYPLGMTLQQGIVCSALCSGMLGVITSTIDREQNSLLLISVYMTVITLSTVGAMIHLFPPMRRAALVPWRVGMLVSWLGLPAFYWACALTLLF